MVNFIKSIYLSSLFKMKANNEITLDLGNNTQVFFPTIYNEHENYQISILKENIITAERDEEIKIQVPKGKTACKIERVVFHSSLYQGKCHSNINSLYCFEYSNSEEYYRILNQYKDVIFNPKICKILIGHSTFIFIKKCLALESTGLKLKTRDLGPYWFQILLPMVLFIAAGSIYFAGRYIIKKLSKLDPIFADFNISSSNILRFQDLEDKSMAQCTICFEDFVDDDDVRVLGCFHYYHPACIDRWLIGHSRKCPCCRHIIEVNERS